jgi:ankyrin repeat protein
VLVKLLLNSAANPNLKNDHGETPLHWAARLGHVDIVKMLISHGANPNVVGQDGTPHSVAAASVSKILSGTTHYYSCLV